MGRPSKQAEGRLEILEAAAKVLAEHGYHGMSMRDLAKALGKTPAGFYNYYASKEELLFDLQTRAFESLLQSAATAVSLADDTPSARLYAFMVQHVQYVASHRPVMQVIVEEAHALPPKLRKRIRELKDRYFAFARDLIAALLPANACARGAKRAPPLDEIELECQTYAVFGMLNWTYGWYRPELHGAPQELARSMHRVLLCGLRPDCPAHPRADAADELVSYQQLPLLQIV